MKRTISLLLTLALMFALSVTAFAASATADITLTYDLSVNGSNDIVVKTGDIITVSYKLSASETSSVSATQNEIYYDHTFFEFVDGSNKQSAGYTDYTTTLQERLSGKRYVYFNTIATHTHDTTPVEIGTFQLKVIASSGESSISNVNYKATDTKAVRFGTTANDLHVSIGTPQTQKFTVTFTGADGEIFKTMTVTAGDSISIPDGPSRTGYDFKYWSIGGDTTPYYPGETYAPKYDVSFAPTWEKNDPHPIIIVNKVLSFDTNGGSTIDSITALKGTKIDLSEYVPTKTGYIFGGWYLDSKLSQKVTNVTLDTSVTVYAKWISEPTREFPFVDVKRNDWFYDDVWYVWDRGLMNGTSANTFSPEMSTTRGMIVTVLYRLSGSPIVYSENPFTDLEAGSYYERAVIWAAANGVVLGYGDGRFGPNDNITREQMAAILYRYASLKGVDVNYYTEGVYEKYADTDTVSAYAVPAMKWACGRNIINGTSETTLSPTDEAKRSQIAAILHRFCENILR